MIEFVKAKKEHIRPIADNLRECDIQELKAASGNTPFVALSTGLAVSEWSWSMLKDGVPVMMFGCCSMSNTEAVASIWMLATDAGGNEKKAIVREGKRYINLMLTQYATLFNYVDQRNEKSIRWLKYLGFEILPTITYGVEGRLFHPFVLERKNV